MSNAKNPVITTPMNTSANMAGLLSADDARSVRDPPWCKGCAAPGVGLEEAISSGGRRENHPRGRLQSSQASPIELKSAPMSLTLPPMLGTRLARPASVHVLTGPRPFRSLDVRVRAAFRDPIFLTFVIVQLF